MSNIDLNCYCLMLKSPSLPLFHWMVYWIIGTSSGMWVLRPVSSRADFTGFSHGRSRGSNGSVLRLSRWEHKTWQDETGMKEEMHQHQWLIGAVFTHVDRNMTFITWPMQMGHSCNKYQRPLCYALTSLHRVRSIGYTYLYITRWFIGAHPWHCW